MAKSRFAVVSKERRTVDGITFDSGKEARRYAELKLLVRAGLISDLECQVPFKVQIAGKHFCTFTTDFTYREAGEFVAEELKSTGTRKDAAYRLRRKAAELAHGIKLREVVR